LAKFHQLCSGLYTLRAFWPIIWADLWPILSTMGLKHRV
jgi:hypothetical protein